MSELYKIDEINMEQSFEYSTINNESTENNLANSNYYYHNNSISSNNGNNYIKTTNLNLNINLSSSSTEYNNITYTAVNKEKSKNTNQENKSLGSAKQAPTQYQSNPYGDNLLSSTLNQLDKEHLCHKSYFDNLPPEIEISVYGTETLPENSVLEAENSFNTSGADTDTTTANNNSNKNRKNVKKGLGDFFYS